MVRQKVSYLVKARAIKPTLRGEVKRGTAGGGFGFTEEQFRGHTCVINKARHGRHIQRDAAG